MEGIKKNAALLKVENYKLLASMVTGKSWNSIINDKTQMTDSANNLKVCN